MIELWVGKPSEGAPRVQFFDSYILELWCKMDFQNYPRDKQVDIKKIVLRDSRLNLVKDEFQVCRYAYEAYITGVGMNLAWDNSIGYFESGLREQVFKAENLDYEANITYVGNGSAVFQILLKRKMTRIAFETIGPTFLLVVISSVSTPMMPIHFDIIKLKTIN